MCQNFVVLFNLKFCIWVLWICFAAHTLDQNVKKHNSQNYKVGLTGFEPATSTPPV